MTVLMTLTVAVVALALGGCEWRQRGPDGSGTIECTEVHVAPEVSGTILELPAQEGMALKRGDLVAKLDATSLEMKADESRAALSQAQAQLDLMTAGSRAEDVQRARDQVREAEAAARAAKADYQRTKAAFDQKSLTPKQMDDAQAAVDRTDAALSAARQVLTRLESGNREEEIRMAQATRDQARARLALAEKAVRDCRVTSPMDGVVTIRVREVGEFVGVGSTLVTVSRLDEVWLSVYIPETRLPKVRLGQKASVRVDGARDLRSGTVTFISPEAEFTPKNVQTPDERVKLVYRLKITLPNSDGFFKPGMPADAYLEDAR